MCPIKNKIELNIFFALLQKELWGFIVFESLIVSVCHIMNRT